jgi:hypothetical protein
MSTPRTLPLDTEHASLEAAGGKETNLTCMVRAGFPVPGGFFTVETQPVLKVAGERLWVDLSGLVRNRIGRRLSIAALGYVIPGAQQALKSLIKQARFPPPGPLSARTALRLARVMAPVVGCVHEATQRIETGQRIRVDGSAGTIVILSDAV